jgi:hypothetical protein
MVDMWAAIQPWISAPFVMAHAVSGLNGEQGLEMWNAEGWVKAVSHNGSVGLEGDLHTPAGPYPGWYTPMHLRVVFEPSDKRTHLTLDLEERKEERAFDDAQTVAWGFIQQWEYSSPQVISQMTTVRFFSPILTYAVNLQTEAPHIAALQRAKS